ASPRTMTHPNGVCPAAIPRSATSTARRMYSSWLTAKPSELMGCGLAPVQATIPPVAQAKRPNDPNTNGRTDEGPTRPTVFVISAVWRKKRRSASVVFGRFQRADDALVPAAGVTERPKHKVDLLLVPAPFGTLGLRPVCALKSVLNLLVQSL